jgi:hypothetical protein
LTTIKDQIPTPEVPPPDSLDVVSAECLGEALDYARQAEGRLPLPKKREPSFGRSMLLQ